MSSDFFAVFVPKTILDDLISLEGMEPRDVTAGGVVYFQSAMLSVVLIYFHVNFQLTCARAFHRIT